MMSGGRSAPSAQAAQVQETGIPMAVGEELECMRTEIVSAGLALDHEAAIDLLTFSLAAQLVGRGFRGNDALDINASEGQRRPYKHRGDAAWLETSPGEALADRIEVPTAWMNERSDKKRWEAFAALEPTERRAIPAKAVAMTLKPRLAYSTVKNHEFEATVARLKPDFAALIRPRADQLWKRVPKERTLKVAAAVFGEEWAERHAKLKRPALAEAVEAAFAGTDPSVDEEGRQRAAEWTLPGFAAFDTRRLGDEPGGRGGRKGAGRRNAGKKKKAAVAKKKAAKAADEPHGAEVTEARGTAETGTAAA